MMGMRCVRLSLSNEILDIFRSLKREGYKGTLSDMINEAIVFYAEELRK